MRLAVHRYWRRFMRLRAHRRWRIAIAAVAALALVVASRLAFGGSAIAAAEDRGTPAAAAPAQDLAAEPPLIRAFAMAFGSPDSAVRRIGTRDEVIRFTPSAIVQAPFGPVLVSEGEVIAPRPHNRGKLAIVYFAPEPRLLRPRASFVPAVESGSFGRIDDWRVRYNFGPYPVIEVRGHGNAGGGRCSSTTLLELRPDGPVELTTIPTSYHETEFAPDRPPIGISGRISKVDARGAFTVTYSGSSSFSERYFRRGDRFVLLDSARTGIRSC